MSELTTKRQHREPMELQLTAMIDVFSMIVIFLILGGIFGASDVILPDDLLLPRSASKESVESAPRIVIEKDKVTASFYPHPIPLASFGSDDPQAAAEIEAVKTGTSGFVKQLGKSPSTQQSLLNVIADQNTPYEKIFNVVKVFREGGFESILFVASGENSSK